jgi:hypothetical protein
MILKSIYIRPRETRGGDSRSYGYPIRTYLSDSRVVAVGDHFKSVNKITAKTCHYECKNCTEQKTEACVQSTYSYTLPRSR